MRWSLVLALTMLCSAMAAAGPLRLGPSPARYYRSSVLPLRSASPEVLRAEPTYLGVPHYGRIILGTGLDTSIAVVLDEATGPAESRVFVDANNDEDLTNDGDGAWQSFDGVQLSTTVTVQADYRTGARLYTRDYRVALRRLASQPPTSLLCISGGAMRGMVRFGGRLHEVALIDEDQDGLYSDLADGVSLVVDRNDDGRLDGRPGQSELFSATDAFHVDGVTYRLAAASDCGDSIRLRRACESVAPMEYIDPGFVAPDFEATDLAGNPVRLSDLRGTATALEFYSSESGPTPNLALARDVWAANGAELRIVSICLDKDPNAARAYAETTPGLAGTVVCSGLGEADPVARKYRADYLPQTFAIGRDGIIRSRGGGRMLWNALVSELGWCPGLPCAIDGKPAPEFEAVDTGGQTLRLSDYRGKVVLVDFWSSWCAPCKAEMPNLIAAYEKYHDRGFEIVGISLDTDRKAMDKDLATMPGISWRQGCTCSMWDDPTARLYGVLGIPSAFLVGADGVLYGTVRGPQVEAGLKELLGE